MVTVTPEGSAFVYSLTIDGEAVDSYNRRVWNNCTRWFFTVDNEPHSCVVIDDNRFALILDGHAIETASDFTEHGSRHMVSVGAYQFVLEVFALDHDTAEPTTSCSSANISDAPPQLYPFQAAAEFNAFSSLSEPSVKQFHPLSSGELNSKSVNSPSSPMSPTNANATKSRKHRFTLSGTMHFQICERSFLFVRFVDCFVRVLAVDGQRITPDVQTRMLQPQLALGQPCARKLLAGLHSQAE
jgi:hypothetical protein